MLRLELLCDGESTSSGDLCRNKISLATYKDLIEFSYKDLRELAVHDGWLLMNRAKGKVLHYCPTCSKRR